MRTEVDLVLKLGLVLLALNVPIFGGKSVIGRIKPDGQWNKYDGHCLVNESKGFRVCRIGESAYELSVTSMNPFTREKSLANGSNYLHSTCVGTLDHPILPIWDPIFLTSKDCKLAELTAPPTFHP